MSDDLVKRLRAGKCWTSEAADRIEALERDLALADDQRREWEHHCKTAEAALAAMTQKHANVQKVAADYEKRLGDEWRGRLAAEARLAKAVEALRALSCKCPSNCDWEHDDVCPSWTARATLAEIDPPKEERT